MKMVVKIQATYSGHFVLPTPYKFIQFQTPGLKMLKVVFQCDYVYPELPFWRYCYFITEIEWLFAIQYIDFATAQLLNRSGDRIPVEVRFSVPVHTGPEAHPASCKMGPGSFPGVMCGGGVRLSLTPF